MQFKRKVSRLYLSLIPYIGGIAVVSLGGMSYTVYLPLWIFHACLMLIAIWILGANVIKNHETEKSHLAVIAIFLILPINLFSAFFGMGVPPENPAQWVATATEQQVRYSLLIIGGILITFGFALLKEKLKNAGEKIYSIIGYTAIMIAVPLFVLNMTFYHSFILEAFRIKMASASEKMPEWFLPVNMQFKLIAEIEVALTYIATCAFAVSLKHSGWIQKTTSYIFIVLSLLGLLLVALYSILPKLIAYPGYPFMLIPAVPFIMPYFMGINLLTRAGNFQANV